jgi:hypothetical protein
VKNCIPAIALFAIASLTACASTKDMMASAVLDRAQHDLTCDSASIRTRMAGNVTRTKSERQGTVERATFAAEGCGGSEVYTVECIRGVCFAIQDVPPRDSKKKQAPDFATGGTPQ